MAMDNKLQKMVEPMPIMDVGLDERILDDDAAVGILRNLTGVSSLQRDQVRNLAQLGIYARGLGILRTQRGRVLISQERLEDTIRILIDRLAIEQARGAKARVSMIRGLAHEISVLTQTMTNTQHLALELEKAAAPTGRPDEVDRPLNQGFGTGTVIAAQQVHVHEAKKELPNKTNGA